ncbi:hypothetical protein J8J14_15840 [Roseomonas sp. SSH11]|uniref:DUF6468 domain-containing protein n=1 Tax=Pararoseomonas baculiformis TaxID=2820812 RepID=A0ABS4AI91_9PROT|nr:DUF6468 domain-containing protein [Pararoseomonas baculiformis]MBP0446245.1 hypothetical protein [Pararoseomonas baculiformis]
MSSLEWAFQGLLLLLLLAALPYAMRLERGLAALRKDRAALAEGAAGFEAATREAHLALSGLRAALETQARQSASAEALRDDLRFLLERAEPLADRLEILVRQGRNASAPPTPEASEPSPRSQAERDLLRALRMAR